LARNPKESTVRTVLRRLEEKGYVTHSVDRRTFVFRAVEARQQVAARAVKRIVDWFCNGSVDDVLVGMADARMLEPRTLERLAARINAAKARR
jgi:predicted transcriptional regulator